MSFSSTFVVSFPQANGVSSVSRDVGSGRAGCEVPWLVREVATLQEVKKKRIKESNEDKEGFRGASFFFPGGRRVR